MSNNAYYLLVAQNFLRNISLDGTHDDTALKIFHERGLRSDVFHAADSAADDAAQIGATPARRNSRDTADHRRPSRNSSTKRSGHRARKAAGEASSSRRKQFRERLTSNSSTATDHNDAHGLLGKIPHILDHRHHTKNRFISTATSEESLTRASIISATASKISTTSTLPGFKLAGGRICVCSQQIPFVVYSVIPFRDRISDKESTTVVDNKSAISCDDGGLKPFSFKTDEEISYSPLLVPTRSYSNFSATTNTSTDTSSLNFPVSNVNSVSNEGLNVSQSDSGYLNRSFPYDANILDNCEFGAGKHKATLTFTSYICSIIDYVDPNDLKKEVNEKFKKRFPDLRLSYSKYRSLKQEMRNIATEVHLDLLTLAHAYVYFDKVVLKSFINKANRKYLAGVGLVLAAKMNDVKGVDLRSLITKIEDTFRITRKDLLEYELPAAIALEFTLHVPITELSSQYQKLLQFS